MVLTNYITSNAVTQACGVYQFSGRYDSGDYLYKQFTLPANHYEVIVRFSVAHIGIWSTADYLKLSIKDGLI
jgi:hypothetical protein